MAGRRAASTSSSLGAGRPRKPAEHHIPGRVPRPRYRYTWTHLFAAVRPATGESFALVLPQVSTMAMNEFLAQFAATLARDEHAVLVLDRAGWHRAKALVIPSNVTLIWLPPYSPQLNPVERVWLFLRERHLSHRLLNTDEAVVDALCRAWNALTPERLRSLTSYPYLQQVKI